MGLADSAGLPQRLAAVVDGLAGVLRAHLTALDPQEDASKPEYEAYVSLVEQSEQVARQLGALADEMTGYRSLPMANHDMEAMMHPRMREVFQAFVGAKAELRVLLEASDAVDQEMLREIQG